LYADKYYVEHTHAYLIILYIMYTQPVGKMCTVQRRKHHVYAVILFIYCRVFDARYCVGTL